MLRVLDLEYDDIIVISMFKYHNYVITNALLPKRLKIIDIMAFNDCNKLKTIDASHTLLYSIRDFAFSYCSSLVSIHMPKTLKYIKKGAFLGCLSLRKVDLFKTEIKRINEYTFYNCYSLVDVKFPKTLKTIDKYAFGNCYSLKEVKLSNINHIDVNAFSGCPMIWISFDFDSSSSDF